MPTLRFHPSGRVFLADVAARSVDWVRELVESGAI